MTRFKIIICLVMLFQVLWAKDRRSRAEAVPGIVASNTVGLGNIWVTGGLETFMLASKINDTASVENRFIIAPRGTGYIGLLSFMHLEATAVPWEMDRLGALSARVKFTTPGNDQLRVYGVAASADITLTSEASIQESHETAPSFDPIFSFTAVADADLVKKYPDFPAKFYLNYSLLDNHRVFARYTQHTLKIAGEIKGEKKSIYFKTGLSLFKEKKTNLNKNPSGSFEPVKLMAGFGYRKRFTKIWPFTIGVDLQMDPVQPLTFLNNELNISPKLSFTLQSSLLYQETNTESLRGLVFFEKSRKAQKLKGTINKDNSDISLDRLLKERLDIDLFQDEILNDVFEKEEREKFYNRRKLIYDEMNSDSENER